MPMISEDDVHAFRDKLDAWGAQLEPGERAVLDLIMVRAFSPAEADVEGFQIVSPRDAASGLPTGKRMHKPFVLRAALDEALPTFVGISYGGTTSSF